MILKRYECKLRDESGKAKLCHALNLFKEKDKMPEICFKKLGKKIRMILITVSLLMTPDPLCGQASLRASALGKRTDHPDQGATRFTKRSERNPLQTDNSTCPASETP